MRDIILNLTSDGGGYSEKTTISIPDDQWELFSDYIEEADILRSTNFVQQGMGGSLTVTFRPEAGVFSRSKPIEEDSTGQMLMRLRPFILQREPLNFQKILNLTRKYCPHPVLSKNLSSLGAHFTLKAQEHRLVSSFANKPISNDDVMNWLNGFEYHRDKEKRGKVLQSLGIYGEDQNGKPLILFAITDMLRAILALSDFLETIKTNSECQKPIGFPEAWVGELDLS